jgi:hypothetical protein
MIRLVCVFLVFLAASASAQELQLTARPVDSATIGRVSKFRFEIVNSTDMPIVLLEIDPDQPCEDSINLVQPLYGAIHFDKDIDEYLYDPLKQAQTSISVSEGYLGPAEKWSKEISYRPFSSKETFQIQFAEASGTTVYRKNLSASGEWFFSRAEGDYGTVILPLLATLPKKNQQAEVTFEGVDGNENPKCFCQALNTFVEEQPFSLYKEWDEGKIVEFKVGDKQEGVGPNRKSAGWKFLDQYTVIFGDGMYTHGEFVKISAEDAPEFWKRIHGKFAIKRINYFFNDHYYDLESME